MPPTENRIVLTNTSSAVPSHTESAQEFRAVRGWLLLLSILILVSLGRFLWQSTSKEPRAVEALAGRYVVDLNSASFAELLALPELGPALAQRIVDYRTKHGPFLCVDDLTQVRGVGAKTLEQLKPMLAVGSPDSASLDSLAER